MTIRKYRWSKHYESAEEELLRLFEAKHITAEQWELETGNQVEAHNHEYDTTFWCAEGSVIFTVDGNRYSLQPGDALDVPAGITFEATAGISGCVCYEAPVAK